MNARPGTRRPHPAAQPSDAPAGDGAPDEDELLALVAALSTACAAALPKSDPSSFYVLSALEPPRSATPPAASRSRASAGRARCSDDHDLHHTQQVPPR